MLDSLSPLLKKRKRIGRGGSRGGTSGKGHKGQKARSGGGVRQVFEGGQMPLTRRLPKRGFSNARFKLCYQIINIDFLDSNFDAGSVINKEILIERGFFSDDKKLLKILGNGELGKKFVVHADAISGTAREAITKNGGEVHIAKES